MTYDRNYCPQMIAVHPIVMEASTPEDRKYMRSMSKDDIHQINGALVQNLYKNTLDHKKIDFGDIPSSKGDITKVKYYESTVECLDILEELTRMNNITEPAIADIRLAISNCKKFSQQFNLAFKTKQEYLILLYNTTVMAIIDSTSMLIATYMDFIIGPDQIRFEPSGKFDRNRGTISLENLRKFNTLCANQALGDAIDYTFKEQKSGTLGTVVMVTGGTVLALISVVSFVRELVFWYSKARISLSDYLEMQAQFLEMHRLAVENSKRSGAEKKDIIKKQERVILKMRRLADKLKLQTIDDTIAVKKELEKENSLFSLSNMEKSIAKSKMDGVSNIQIV